MTGLPTLGSTTSFPPAHPVAIDDEGRVGGSAGTPDGPTHAVLWQDGRIVDQGALVDPARPSSAIDINDRGQVPGHVHTATSIARAVLWTVEP